MAFVKLDSGWVAARASDVSQTGEELTTSEFPSLETKGWMEGVVPGTILTTLLKNGLIPDPFYGMENENIVDIGDAGRNYYTFWFCKSFTTPESGYILAWLQFRAINYSADVYVNGHKTSLPKGMFRRHKVDITGWLNPKDKNYLAVLIHPPDHPGHIPPEGGQGGDHDIAKDVAAQYVEGWDWIIPIRDRNTGLWDEVSLLFTGPITINDPHLVTTFYDNYTRAYLHASTELHNASSEDMNCSVKINVTRNIEDEFCSVEHIHSTQLTVKGGTRISYTFPGLFFYKPQLWWPNGMGKQPLYNVDIVVEVGDNEESDAWNHRIGFRHIDSHIDSSTGGRVFEVNGHPVFIRGGNYILSDGLLRLSKQRYKTEVGFHADMNMNMIRVWAGALAERPEFYDACDERGLLVWQEFWITGDCNGRGIEPSEQSWPLDHELFMTCARDTVKLLRNHASLALWVGGNEQVPADDINEALKSELTRNPTFQSSPNATCDELDVTQYLDGTRLYIQGSLWNGFADGKGGWSDGPYGIQNPEDFFEDNFYPYAFNPEIGSVAVPSAATIRATMPEEAWEFPQIVQRDGGLEEIPHQIWDYHKYLPYSGKNYCGGEVPHQIAAYGKIKDMEDFCYKAQLVNYIQYKALIESWNSRMWERYSGVLIWKTQNPWSGLRGGLYDFLLAQTGGFFGTQSAAEPVHIQLNLATNFVEIVNTTGEQLTGGRIEVNAWEPDGTSPYQTTFKQESLPPHKTVKALHIPYGNSTSAESVLFLLLKLFNNTGELVSRNFYWLHKPGSDYSSLTGEFQSRKVPVQVSAVSTQEGDLLQISAQVKNVSAEASLCSNLKGKQSLNESGPGVAFWLHFSVLNEAAGEREDKRVLPVNYSNNFFSLVPGELMDVQISFKIEKGVVPKVTLQGWNIDEVQVLYQPKGPGLRKE
ncbi:unnamed protein product [Calypogeia fissa]